MGKQEHVILVNEQGVVTGTQEKYAAHTSQTPLHLAFSCWIFNAAGQSLVTRRALSKKPGQASGRTPFAGIRKKGKPPNRPLFAAAVMKSAPGSGALPPSHQSSVTVKPILPASWKTKSARSSPHKSQRR